MLDIISLKGRVVVVIEVIYHNDLFTLFQESIHQMRTYKASTASYQDMEVPRSLLQGTFEM